MSNDFDNNPEPPKQLVEHDVPEDLRVYVPFPDGWSVHIKKDGIREYCYFKSPGQDWYHLILPGEIHLQYGESRFCLNCAMRYGHLTKERLFWQNGPRRKQDPIA